MRSQIFSRCLLYGIGVIVLLACGGCGRTQRQQPVKATTKPNVIFIVVDALRADRLRAYGYPRPTSPHLDALAQESVIFLDAMSQASYTTPSLTSLLTGRRSYEHTISWGEQEGIPYTYHTTTLPILAEMLREEGYTTAAFSASPLLGTATGTERGFDTIRYTIGRLPIWRHGSAADVNARALPWLRMVEQSSQPFFLYLHYIDPHNLYRPPSEFCIFGRPGYTAEDEQVNVEMNLVPDTQPSGVVTDRMLREHGFTRDDVTRMSDLYDGEVRCADAAIGELIDYLKTTGNYARTIMVITADHGEAFLEHRHLEHGTALYQELLHVPLIMHLPGISPQKVSALAESVDIVPTILDAIGKTKTPQFTGRSLYKALQARQSLPTRLAIAELPVMHAYAARLGPWKLLHYPTRDELYDLAHDPGEERDLAAAHPEHVARLLTALRTELARRPASPPRKIKASPKELEALKSLGYLK